MMQNIALIERSTNRPYNTGLGGVQTKLSHYKKILKLHNEYYSLC